MILGRNPRRARDNGGRTTWRRGRMGRPERAEEPNLRFAGAWRSSGARDPPVAAGVRDVAEQQGFFHWELDFATGVRARRL